MIALDYGKLFWFGDSPLPPQPGPYLPRWLGARRVLKRFKPFGLPVRDLSRSSRADDEFAASIKAMVDAVPAGISAVMHNFGMAVIPVRDLDDVLSWLSYLGPGGTWEKRTQWDTVSGVCMFEGHLLVIARNRSDPTSGGYHMAENRQGVFNHELGHGLDAARGYISRSREFLTCVATDLEKLDPISKLIYRYLLQSLPTGPSEIFAECFACTQGMCAVESWTKDMPKYFPESYQFVKKLVDELSSSLP